MPIISVMKCHNPANIVDAVDFGSTDATAITHPRRRWLPRGVIPLGWNIYIRQKEEIIEDIVPARQVGVNVERRSVVPLLGKGSSFQPRIPLIEHIDIVINSDPSTADHGTFPPRVSYKFTLDGTGTSEVPPGGDARGHVHCFHVLACYDRCLPRVHVKDGEFWSGDPDPEPRRVVLFLTYLFRLGLLVVFMYSPECRDLGFGNDSLAKGLGRVGSFDLGRRIDEPEEQKAINIVRESYIERKLWWDLGSVDVSEPFSWLNLW